MINGALVILIVILVVTAGLIKSSKKRNIVVHNNSAWAAYHWKTDKGVYDIHIGKLKKYMNIYLASIGADSNVVFTASKTTLRLYINNICVSSITNRHGEITLCGNDNDSDMNMACVMFQLIEEFGKKVG